MSKQTKARTGECVGFVVVGWENDEPFIPGYVESRADARLTMKDERKFNARDGIQYRIARVVLDK